MRYTFGQAKKRLAGYGHTFGITDLGEAINYAISALAGLSGWECLRKVVRFSSAGPCFALPQGAAGLVRICVNGHPATVRGQDFRFVQSGPGDTIGRPPEGFDWVPIQNVLDDGTSPFVVDPERLFRLVAYSDAEDQPGVTVRGLDPTGRAVREVVPMTSVYTSLSSATPSGTTFACVTDITIDEAATGFVTLYAVDAVSPSVRYFVGLYNPGVKAPVFRKYHLPGIAPGQPVEILAEVRIDPLPLVDDADVLPFDSVEPIEWMMNYDFDMKSGEVDKALKYQQQAVQWLKSREVANDAVQTQFVVNSLVPGSLGEDSMASYNI